MIFTSVGYEVHLYDVSRDQIDQSIRLVQQTLKEMEQEKVLKGKLSADQQFSLVRPAYDLKSLLKDAIHCQVIKKTVRFPIIRQYNCSEH
jgi:L-gulonate 3-dehydrogenase